MPIIEGAGGLYFMRGVPGNGTNAVFTVSLGATITGGDLGSFVFDGYTSGVVAWSSSNTTLAANMQAALNAMPSLGTGAAVAAAGTAVAGSNGTFTITLSGASRSGTLAPNMTLTGVALEGGSTASIAYSTSGVNAAFKNAALGALCCDTSTNGKLYHNSAGVVGIPTWTAQS